MPSPTFADESWSMIDPLAPQSSASEATGVPAIGSLGLGTWRLEGETCRRAVAEALALGYRHFDTAQGYGNEREVGAALRASGVPRAALHVTTKVWPDHLLDEGTAAVRRSLDALGLERIDLALLHWPSPSRDSAAALRVLAQARDEGLTRAIGVSNFPIALLEEAVRITDVACNQIELHPYLPQWRLRRRLRELGVAAVSYAPLAQGRIAADPVVADVAAAAGCSAAQVALAWLLRRGIHAVPKASSVEHLRENLAALAVVLHDDALALLDQLDCGLRLVDPEFAPVWDL